MGVINIKTSGSFPQMGQRFSALEHGHARAVADAIKWLSEVVLPGAIRQDHMLHSDGLEPEKGFGYVSFDNQYPIPFVTEAYAPIPLDQEKASGEEKNP